MYGLIQFKFTVNMKVLEGSLETRYDGLRVETFEEHISRTSPRYPLFPALSGIFIVIPIPKLFEAFVPSPRLGSALQYFCGELTSSLN